MADTQSKIRLGISACLLGQRVRYDGADKRDAALVEALRRYVEFVPVCPEVEAGLGVPREAMRLECRRCEGCSESHPRLVTRETRRDLTEMLESWARWRVGRLRNRNLSGFIFKAKSPSCGLRRVTLYGKVGRPARKAVGIFARIFVETFPRLVVADEEELTSTDAIAEFVARLERGSK